MVNMQIAMNHLLALKYIKLYFRSFVKLYRNGQAYVFFWGVGNSLKSINKISNAETAYIINTFDFSTWYTNLTLHVIYESLISYHKIVC